MDKIFKSIGNLSSKAAGKVLDALTLTPLEKVQGKKANVVERASQTVGDWFKPAAKIEEPDNKGYQPVQAQTRVRDVIRELPNAFSEVIGKPIARSAATVGEKIAQKDIGAQYIPKTDLGKFISDDKPIDFGTVGKEVVGENLGNKFPIATSIIGGTFAVSDVLPGGSGRKAAARGTIDFVSDAARGLAKTLARETDIGKIAADLTKAGVRAEDAAEIAPAMSRATNADEVMTAADQYVQTKKAAADTETLYHGTSAPDFDRFETGDGLVYLTRSADEAQSFAENPIIGGGRGRGVPRTLEVSAPKGKTKDINEIVQEEVYDGGDIDEVIIQAAEQARREGYDFLSFRHPSTLDGVDDFEAIVAINPEKLGIKTKRAAEAPAEQATKLYHGTNDISWVERGENIKRSESSTLGNGGVFFTKDPQSANDWIPASGGYDQTKTAGKVGGVVELESARNTPFNLKKMDEGEYERMMFDASDELYANPEKFGTDKYGVNDTKAWEIVDQRLKEQGFDGVDFGESGVIFDPATIKASKYNPLDRATEAFGGVAGLEMDDEGNVTYDPLKGALGVGAGATVRRIKDGGNVRWVSDAKEAVKAFDEAGETAGARQIAQTMPEPDAVVQALKQTPEEIAQATVPPKERQFVSRVRALDSNTDAFLKGEYTPRSTKDLAAVADNLIENDYARAVQMATEGLDDRAVAVASRLIDKLVTTARNAPDEVTKSELYEKASTIANEAARNLTEHGRAIQAATLLGKTTPEGMVRFAARQIQKYNEKVGNNLKSMFGPSNKIPELTPEQTKSIVEKMDAIQKITDPVEKAIKIKEVTDEVRELVPSSMYDKISTVWKAGLLTGAKTHLLNFFSNLAFNMTEVVKDAPAAVVDAVASMFTGKRTLAMTLRGLPEGMKQGASKGWRYWKTGFDERDVGTKLDFNQVNFGKSAVGRFLQGYTDTIFRSLGTSDQPFYYGARMRSLASQAIAAAKNEGLKGADYAKRVQQLIDNPTDEMLRYATLDAETAVFQNKTWLGDAAKAMQRIPGFQFIVPFAKTPGAVATQLWNYSPGGLVATIAKNARKGRFDQRAFSQGVGRGLVGTLGAMYVGKQLYEGDQVTLAMPTSEKERAQWELEGRKPNTIYINGKWRSPAILGPIGLSVIVGAHVEKAMQETGSPMGAFAALAGGIGSTVTEQSFLQGVNKAIEAAKDPERSFNGFASSFVGSLVPTIVADIARSVDPYERRTSSPTERVLSRIPGLRQNLEPRVSAVGNRMEVGNPLTAMFDPTRPGIPGTSTNDPVVKELGRLAEEGYVTTPTVIGPKEGYKALTPKENTTLLRTAGTMARDAMQRVMETSSYRQMDDEQRQRALENAVEDAKIEARARVVAAAAQGKSKEQVNKLLAGLKEEKMLTKDVYGMYLSLTRNQ